MPCLPSPLSITSTPLPTLPLSGLREILLPLKDASNGSKSLSKSHSTPNASHSPLGNYSSTGHPFHQLFQRTHQSFHWELQENKGFCFHTNRFCSSLKRSVLGFSSVLARGCSPAWSSHHWQAPSQSGGSLISPKVSAIRPTLPSQNQRARPRSKTTEGNKKRNCILYIFSNK